MNELYGVLREGVVRMTGTGATLDQVAAVIEVLRKASERKEQDVAAVVAELKQRAPEQTALIDYLNKVAPAGGMLAAFLLLFATILIALFGSQTVNVSVNVEPPSDERISAAVAKALAEQNPNSMHKSADPRTEKNRKKRERRLRRSR